MSLVVAGAWLAIAFLLRTFALRADGLAATVRGFAEGTSDPTWRDALSGFVGSAELAWTLAVLAAVFAAASVLRPARLPVRAGLLLAAFTIPYGVWIASTDSAWRTEAIALVALASVATIAALVASRWTETPTVVQGPRPWVMPPSTHQG